LDLYTAYHQKKTVFQRLIMKQCVGTSDNCSYNGLGGRLKQTLNGTEKDFTLDLNAGLTQVLAYGGDTYLYGLNRLGYDNSIVHIPDVIFTPEDIRDFFRGC
jgi:hypothetical protein